MAATPTVASAAPHAACAQIARSQVQPLLVHRITKVTVKPVPGYEYVIGSKKPVGQECVFADTMSSGALTVTVIAGPAATKAYAGELKSLVHITRVAGVGEKAWRQRADANGAVSTAEVASIKGSIYCAVSPEEGETPGEARLEKAAGDTADIGDKAYADIAAAIGTVCNRIFGSGSTNPQPALKALKQITPAKHNAGGDLTVPTPPSAANAS